MTNLPIASILFFSISLPSLAIANDPYGDGYYNTLEGHGHWSDGNDVQYQFGYDDAQRELQRRQEEEQLRRGQEQQRFRDDEFHDNH